MTNSADAIAAFLAKGGKIQKVETGANSGITNRQFYLASKGEINLKPVDNSEQIAERRMETFRDTRYTGGSVSEALDAMNDVF